MGVQRIHFQENWMHNLNSCLGRSQHIKCIRYACHT